MKPSFRALLPALSLIVAASHSAADSRDTIDTIADQPSVRAALQHLVAMERELLDDLVELTEIPAPPFAEGPRGERFAAMLAEAGLTDITTDAAGNVIGRRPGRNGERVIALTAHLDTVFPAETNVTVRVEGNRYIAPGVGDNSRGLVVLLGILRALEQAVIETEADVLFVGNIGEEGLGDLRGVKHLFRNGNCLVTEEPVTVMVGQITDFRVLSLGNFCQDFRLLHLIWKIKIYR